MVHAKFVDCECQNASNAVKPACSSFTRNGNINTFNICDTKSSEVQYSSRKSFRSQPSNKKIVILEAAATMEKNTKHSPKETCYCSSMQSHKKVSNIVLNAKTTPLFFREMKRKLKCKFGGTRQEPNKFSVDSNALKLSQSRPRLKVRDGRFCHGLDISNSLTFSANVKRKAKQCKKQELLSNTDAALITDKVRKKLDIPSAKLHMIGEFDVILEAKRHLYARSKNLNKPDFTSRRTLGRILFSPEHECWSLSPASDSNNCSGSAHMRFNPHINFSSATQSSSQESNEREMRAIEEFTSLGLEAFETKSVYSLLQNTDEAQYAAIISAANHKKFCGEPETEEISGIPQTELLSINEIKCRDLTIVMQRTDTIELHQEDGNNLHSSSDSLSQNETFTSMVDDPSTIYQLNVSDRIKHQEHQSPVSVLEPFFREDANSPSSIALQPEMQPLQARRRLHFEECSIELIPQNLQISEKACIHEHDYISHFVHFVLQASCLNWKQLSEITQTPDEELLSASLLDEAELFLPNDFDSKLLFDHMNEILLHIYQCYFISSPWLEFRKPKIGCVPLEKVVLDEIMKEVHFYLLQRNKETTLDNLVSKDASCPGAWLNIEQDAEEIMIDVSDDIMQECILDLILD